jgi:hypothetical protein
MLGSNIICLVDGRALNNIFFLKTLINFCIVEQMDMIQFYGWYEKCLDRNVVALYLFHPDFIRYFMERRLLKKETIELSH